MARGEIFIVAAPSGAGLTALVDRVMAGDPERAGGLHRAVSHTTRGRREGEVDGREYHFVDRGRFERLIDEDRLLEWTEYGGWRYGTSREEVDSRLERGLDVVLETDLQGAERLRASCPEARTIVAVPAGADVSSSEKRPYDLYDCVILVQDLMLASDALAVVLLENEPRVPQRTTPQDPAGPRSRR